MTKGQFPTAKFQDIQTPFYYYDTELLRETLRVINSEAQKHEGFCVHYAVKANANPRILRIIREAGLGADCVSGGEIEASVKAGFPSSKIVYAGVGKSDWEINLGLDNDIFWTGLAENKFGIDMRDMLKVIEEAQSMANVKVVGLHFHIGSQILDMGDFEALCNRVNELQLELERHQIQVEHINVGGGLGVDYQHPNRVSIPDFKSYFDTYAKKLKLRPGQTLHFELGRAVVAQCGSLITRTLYIKEGSVKKFAIVDVGFTDLIRPALYQAYHKIENISSEEEPDTYDVVGPICESTDVFAKQIDLNRTHRGNLLAIRSAGAYGEIMASQYNCRRLPKGYMSDEI